MNKNKCIILLSFILIFFSCISKYDYTKDKNVIQNKELLNDWKFKIVVYYNNPQTLFPTPLEIGQIRDGQYEKKVEHVFYERTFSNFLSTVFFEKTKIINNEKLKNEVLLSTTSICDIYDRNNNLILWFSYNSSSEYMILNGNLVEVNQKLYDFVNLLLNNDIIIP